jgi:spermidine synthase
MAASTLDLKQKLFIHDALLITIMGTLAACGLIYEYLMAHYAGRVLGAMESTIYAMIGIMIVSMGVGAFIAKWVKCPFNGFVWLEWAIGFAGATSIIVISLSFSLSYTLPTFLQEIYGLHPTITTDGEFVRGLTNVTKVLPFLAGGLLGLMIGMEIPLIARIREDLHGEHLEHNIGTIYGADYIGAGIGAAIWVLVCLQLPIIIAAVATSLVNSIVGIVFIIIYKARLTSVAKLFMAHSVLLGIITALAFGGANWMENMQAALFKDAVIHTKMTPYQHLTLTERHVGKGLPKVTSLYINGRLQFSSNDEEIYHSYLTYPALRASARQDNVLVVGGGDGLAVRDILQWNPQSVTLIDLDKDMISMFKGDDKDMPSDVTRRILAMNRSAFRDPRVSVVIGDAFVEVEKLLSQKKSFDAIIVDLPDPSHPDINKVYSDFFYSRLKDLLAGDGVMVVQSTSPYHSQKAFISIGKTVQNAGFITEQYHTNVPTFGEWGWTIGTKVGKSAKQRLASSKRDITIESNLSKEQMMAAFVFPTNFYADKSTININHLGSHATYQYHQEAWGKHEGVFYTKRKNSVAKSHNMSYSTNSTP